MNARACELVTTLNTFCTGREINFQPFRIRMVAYQSGVGYRIAILVCELTTRRSTFKFIRPRLTFTQLFFLGEQQPSLALQNDAW